MKFSYIISLLALTVAVQASLLKYQDAFVQNSTPSKFKQFAKLSNTGVDCSTISWKRNDGSVSTDQQCGINSESSSKTYYCQDEARPWCVVET